MWQTAAFLRKTDVEKIKNLVWESWKMTERNLDEKEIEKLKADFAA
jgi:hypothetical protein